MFKPSLILENELRDTVLNCCPGVFELIDAEDWCHASGLPSSLVDSTAAHLGTTVPIAVLYRERSTLAARLTELGKNLHTTVCEISDTDANDFSAKFIALLAKQAVEARQQSAKALASAALLRRDYDALQGAFHSVEAALDDFDLPSLRLALAWPITASSVSLNKQNNSCVQCLPISARGICAVELHFTKESDMSSMQDGSLTISLENLGGHALAPARTLPLSALAAGWHRISFDEATACNDCDAQIRVVLDGQGAATLSLAPPSPLEEYNLGYGPKRRVIMGAPLAVKVWKGLPGLRTVLAKSEQHQGYLIKKRASELKPARLLFADGEPMTFDPVQFWPKEDAFLVHPPGAGLTVGVIEGIDCARLKSVSAVVNNGHHDAPVLSFAIAVLPHGRSLRLAESLGNWLNLPALAWGEVHAALPRETSEKFDVFLASKVAHGNSNKMAWALFRGLIFRTALA